MDGPVGLGALVLSSFVSATLLPGGSELLLFAVVSRSPALLWPALGLATLGNTLGGLTSYLLGRLLPQRKVPAREVVWLRVDAAKAALYLAVGKGLRYGVVAFAALS